jgi:predicted ribosome quality control (RQC) complex YloA/Tae2 family protein
MPLDGLFLHFLLREIQQQIFGSRVEKLHQPSKEELVLLLRSRNGATRLRLSAASNGPRVNLTQSAPENPKTPPMFCMLMRKYLTGAILRVVRQIGLDRVAFFCFDGTNEIGDRVKYTLCAEIMAKQSNVILLDENDVVIDSVKRIDFTKSEIRPVMPGVPYVLPPSQGKRNI